MELNLTTGERYSTIALGGRFTASGAPRFRAAVQDLVQSGHANIVIDLAGTTFIDSSALGALIGGLKASRTAGGDLRIAGLTDPVRSVLRLTNLDRVLREYPDPASAFDQS